MVKIGRVLSSVTDIQSDNKLVLCINRNIETVAD